MIGDESIISINNRWRYRRKIAITSFIMLFLWSLVALYKFAKLPLHDITIANVLYLTTNILPFLIIIVIYFIASTIDDIKKFVSSKLK
jgi:hypothetical protein